MKPGVRVTAWAAAAALAAAGCASAPAPRPRPPAISRGVAAVEPAADPRPYGAADTAFGLAALSAWCRADPQANLVLSPAGLATGLGLAYLGARGSTARAMAAVLHLPAAGGRALEAGLQARSAALRGLGRPGVTLAAAAPPLRAPIVFNRPYLMLVTDTAAGEPLFLARVANPAAS